MNIIKKVDKTATKRLLMDIPVVLHRQIKEWALYRNTSIKQYVIEAIIERMKKDTLFYK